MANHSAPSTPKHGVLRNEMCVVLFRRESSSIYSAVVDTLLGYVPDVTLASAPYYSIESTGDLRDIPHVKLFLLICDCNVGYSNVVTSRDLRLASIRVMHRLGGTNHFGIINESIIFYSGNNLLFKPTTLHVHLPTCVLNFLGTI